jgi:F-type H+-transporting ATPase subunit a
MAASEGTRGPDPSVHCAPLAELFHLASDVDFRHPRLEHRHAVLVDRVRDRDDRLLRLAARKATSGVPGRFQCASKCSSRWSNQAKAIVHGDRTFIAPLALTVFVWVALMNSSTSCRSTCRAA